MASNRVIQDSDDDEDPLSCEAQPPPPIVSPRQDNRPENNNWDDNTSAVNGSGVQNGIGDIGVNFDVFLQSQSQDAQRRASVSSSQRRREERWIPGGFGNGIARGPGSIGKDFVVLVN